MEVTLDSLRFGPPGPAVIGISQYNLATFVIRVELFNSPEIRSEAITVYLKLRPAESAKADRMGSKIAETFFLLKFPIALYLPSTTGNVKFDKWIR